MLGFRPRVWNNFMATWGPTRRVYAYLVKVRVMGGPAWITHVRHISPLPLSYFVKVRVVGGPAWITHVRHISPLPLSYLVKVRVMGGRAWKAAASLSLPHVHALYHLAPGEAARGRVQGGTGTPDRNRRAAQGRRRRRRRPVRFPPLVDAPPVWHPGPPGLTALLRRVDRSGKMFSRAIVAVYTPGAVLDDDDPSFADLLLRNKAVGAGGGRQRRCGWRRRGRGRRRGRRRGG